MYDVEGLEKEWNKYKTKQQKPWIIFTVLVALVVLFVVYRAEVLTLVSENLNDMNGSVVKQEIEQNSTALTPFVPTLAPEEESNQSVQEEHSTQSRVESNESIENNNSHPPMMIELDDEEPQPEKEHKRKYLKIVVTDMYPSTHPESKKSTNLIRKKDKQTIESAKENFSRHNDYSDSLYLARTYYKRGEYASAQKWALATNNLNSKIEESWLIFAKSKAKLGQKREAEQILGAYIKETNSNKARALLLAIKKGNF